MTKPKQSEQQIQKAISDWLAWHHIVHWRQNSGAAFHENFTTGPHKKRKRLIRFSYFGYPKPDDEYPISHVDIEGIYKGRHLAIEVKTDKGKLTEGQWNYLCLVNDNGGIGFMARSVEDVENYLKQIDMNLFVNELKG